MEPCQVFSSAGRGNKLCESCQLAKPTVFCQADSAFLCQSCDAEIHGANKVVARHRRERMCVVCEQAPAVASCSPSGAVLCITCNEYIHTHTNRHQTFHEKSGEYSSPSKLVEGSDIMSSEDDLSTYVDSFLVFDGEPSSTPVHYASGTSSVQVQSELPSSMINQISSHNYSDHYFWSSIDYTSQYRSGISQLRIKGA